MILSEKDLDLKKRRSLDVISGLVFIYFSLRLLLMDSMSIHPDVTLFGVLAQKVFYGKIFLKDFFEVSPFSAFLFYLPSSIIQNIFSINLFTSLALFLWFYFSFILFQLKNGVIGVIGEKGHYLFLLILTLLVFIVPELGQREVIFSVTFIAYIFKSMMRIYHGKTKLGGSDLTLSFLMCFTAMLKPQFFIFWVMGEFFLYFKQGHKILKMKYAVFASVLLINFIYFLLINYHELPFYLKLIGNHVNFDNNYHRFMFENNEHFMSLAIICVVTGMVGIICQNLIGKLRSLSILFASLNLLGVVFAFLQFKGWMYHLYASLFFSIVGVGLIGFCLEKVIFHKKINSVLIPTLFVFIVFFKGMIVFNFHKGMKSFFLDSEKKQFDQFFNNIKRSEQVGAGLFFSDTPFFLNYIVKERIESLNTFLWSEPIPIFDSKVMRSQSYTDKVINVYLEDFKKEPSFYVVNNFCVFCASYDGIKKFLERKEFVPYTKKYKHTYSSQRFSFYVLKNKVITK